jgi:hypothetical protein
MSVDSLLVRLGLHAAFGFVAQDRLRLILRGTFGWLLNLKKRRGSQRWGIGDVTNDELIGKVKELEERLAKLEAKKTRSGRAKGAVASETKSPGAQVRDAFLGSFRTVFGHDYPGWGARENGMAGQWLKSVPLERALEYALIYPHWKDYAVFKAGHPFSLLVQRYVQLDAHMKRYPEIVNGLIGIKARENVEINDKVKDHESRIYADIQAKPNPLIGGGTQDQIPLTTNGPVLGTCGEPSRPDLRLVSGEKGS